MILRIVAALMVLVGLATALWIGPDHRIEHELDVAADTVAITSAPAVLSWSGIRVEVTARLPDEAPVFVGFGRSIDVGNFLAQTQHVEVIDVSGTRVETMTHPGDDFLPSAPTALDWWLAADAGLGQATAALTVPNQQVSIAIVGVADTALTEVDVAVAYGIPGGFWLSVGVIVLGLALGVWSWRRG